MSEEEILIKELKSVIAKELSACCNTKLPRLQKFVETPEGMERAEGMIFSMCANDGIAVQTAMSQLDSDLGQSEE